MTDFRIDYISKPDPYGRIEQVGGNSPNAWRATEEVVFAAIRAGDTFHVIRAGYRVAVMMANVPEFLAVWFGIVRCRARSSISLGRC